MKKILRLCWPILVLSGSLILGCAGSTCPSRIDPGGIHHKDATASPERPLESPDTTTEEEKTRITLQSSVPDNSIFLELAQADSSHLVVEVRARGIEHVALLSLSLAYDTQLLQLEEVRTLDIFDEQDKAGIFRGVEVPKGRITLGGAYFGLKRSRALDDAPLAILRFLIKGHGIAKITFLPAEALVVGRDHKGISVELLDATVEL